ncbi:DNA-formamidopyrimidine glycosylase [Amphibacillus jilinensis]|uniref:DNA-formamidopyrimidine glycosylase n=1 Tax=Amphibacillus jilinensis TaxID=1216008 RepID=UPI0002F13C7A|nr:DNA-formamidopyrimidine glycosylase [Amphibacillus jilinensis]
MPELPEVETVRKTLLALVLNERIKHVDVQWPNMIKMPAEPSDFQHLLEGQSILNIKRKGKFLIFELDSYSLVSHLRMEGKYGVYAKDEPIDKHTHVIFYLESGKTLRYHDVRKFGTMHLFAKGEAYHDLPLKQLGPDPFDQDYTVDHLLPKINKSTRAIKNILLDQTVIAGLGNIYVDETLFRARIHPLRSGDSLDRKEVQAIIVEAKATIEEAVKQGGTTIRSYVNSQGEIGMFQQQLYAYGQEGQPCVRCGTEVLKIKVSNRGTHLCPSCQQIS